MTCRVSPGQAGFALASGRVLHASPSREGSGCSAAGVAGDDVAGDIGQPQVTCISIGAQPHECIPDAGGRAAPVSSAGGLVDLGPAKCQVRGLATGAAHLRREVAPPPWSWASSSSTVAVSAKKISASPSWKAVSGPGRPRYRPSTPAMRIAPASAAGTQRSPPPPPGRAASAKTGQRRSGFPCRPDPRPAPGRLSAAASRHVALPQGQMKLGASCSLTSSVTLHQVTCASRTARGTQLHAPVTPNRSHSRRAHIRGRHLGRRGRHGLETRPGPRPCPAWLPASSAQPAQQIWRLGSGPAAFRGQPDRELRATSRMGYTGPSARAVRRVIALPPPPACCRGLPCSAPQGFAFLTAQRRGRGQRILLSRRGHRHGLLRRERPALPTASSTLAWTENSPARRVTARTRSTRCCGAASSRSPRRAGRACGLRAQAPPRRRSR